jgi:hypothetical protein
MLRIASRCQAHIQRLLNMADVRQPSLRPTEARGVQAAVHGRGDCLPAKLTQEVISYLPFSCLMLVRCFSFEGLLSPLPRLRLASGIDGGAYSAMMFSVMGQKDLYVGGSTAEINETA